MLNLTIAPATAGPVVSMSHFGTNYLADREARHNQGIEGDNVFGHAADMLGTNTFRYPGGAITEMFLDLADPKHFDAGKDELISATDRFTDRGETFLTPVGQFLNFVAERNGDATIVLPTITYFEDLASGNLARIAAVEAEIKAFVVNALQHPGGNTITAFQIGNEYVSWSNERHDWLISHSRDYAMLAHRRGRASTDSAVRTRKAACMLSESARMTTAREAGYRVPYANSKPRAARIVALDATAAAIVDDIAKLPWNGAKFFTSLSFEAGGGPDGTPGGMKAWLNDLAGRALDLYGEIASSDFVVVITAAGEDARAVTVISAACNVHNKTLIGLVVPKEGASEADVATSLEHLRPHARMLVVASGRDYIEVMLTALRA